MPPGKRLLRERLVRLVADMILVNASWLGAFVLRVIVALWFETNGTSASEHTAQEVLLISTQGYLRSALPLTLTCLAVFFLSGFYTYGRAYRGRYKALVIFRAVTLAYLLFWFVSSFLRLGPAVSRGVLVGGWLATLALVEAARLMAVVWAVAVRTEDRALRATATRVERVLVIGGAGFLGSVLVRKLLAKGHHVRVLDTLLYGDEAMSELRSHRHFEFIHSDFRNIEAVVRATQDMDAVVHLGAIVGDPASTLDEEFTREVNVAATRLIAEVAKGHGTQRLVFTSTCSVYGSSNEVLNELSSLNPQTVYDHTKLDAERVLLGMVDADFSPVILRLATLYGLSYRPRFDLVVNLLTAKAVLEKKITVFGGSQWRPFVHVDDAAEGIVRCLEAPVNHIRGQIFNVGGTDHNHRIGDVAQLISALVPGTIVEVNADAPDMKNYYVSCEKIKQVLGFRPARTIEHAVIEIREALQRGWIKDYQAKEYSNFRFLEAQAHRPLVEVERRYGSPSRQLVASGRH